MKFSISVPDELWKTVDNDMGDGPSVIVQRALRALAAQQGAASNPMAGAPGHSALDQYRPAFEEAVAGVAGRIEEVLESGYRFGMVIAPGLTMTDFDLLDDESVAIEQMRYLVNPDLIDRIASTEDLVSTSLRDRFATVSSSPDGKIALGTPEAPAPGVRWEEDEYGEYPEISQMFARAMVAALRDVRDESLRRIQIRQPAQEPRS
jgi:hypothetical protein